MKNKQPIETARDADLRLSKPALLRAAQSARKLAAATGTRIVVSRDGVIEHITPQPSAAELTDQEPGAPYGDEA